MLPFSLLNLLKTVVRNFQFETYGRVGKVGSILQIILRNISGIKMILTFCPFDQHCQPRRSRCDGLSTIEKAFVSFQDSVVVAVVGFDGCS